MNLLDITLRYLAKDRLSVLLFHKVPGIADPLRPSDIDLPSFERLLDFVTEHFNVIPLDDAVKGIHKGRLPPRSACITFDDGYEGWLEGAVPALERRKLHATFFITTGQFKGIPMWHERVAYAVGRAPAGQLTLPGFGIPALALHTQADRQQAIGLIENFLKYQQLDVRDALIERLENVAEVRASDVPRMSVQDLRAMHGRGFGIGAHTDLHPILALCNPEQAKQEIGSVREELSGLIGGKVDAFAYPNGRPVTDFNADHIRMVQQAGYKYAVTTQWGRADVSTPVYQIPRFTPWGPNRTYTALQMARNLVSRPRLFRIPQRSSCDGTVTPAVTAASAPAATPIRVLFVENGAGFGGAVIALQTLTAHLPPTDIHCHIVTNLPVGNFAGLPAVRSHCIIGDRLHNFRPLVQRLRNRQLGALTAPLLFAIGRADDIVNRLPYLLRLLVHAARLRPHIIHGNNEPNSNREALLVAKLLRKPYVQHLRGPLGPSRGNPWLLAKADVFIPVSRWLAAELLTTGVTPDKVRQIYDAVDLSALRTTRLNGSLREELKVAPNTIIVAMIGMLVPWKGQHVFIDAVRQFKESDQPVLFLIVGGTPARGDDAYAISLHREVEEHGLQRRILFTGQRDDIPALLPEVDVVVSASTSPEPLGLVMLEAMASGCVFVAPAHGAATELVVDGKNGFLFSPGDSRSLAEKLGIAINAKRSSTMTPRELQAHISDVFSAQLCASSTLNLHRNIYQGTL